MSRYIGIDHGTKRIGLSLADRETGVVTPLDAIPARNHADADTRAVLKVVEHYDIDAVVLGLPLNMDGTEGEQARLARQFGALLSDRSGLPVYYQDERLSTFAADELLADTGLSREKRRRRRDSLAAAAILQSFLADSSD